MISSSKGLTVRGKKAIAPSSPTMALKNGKMHASTVVKQTMIERFISFRGLIGSTKPQMFRSYWQWKIQTFGKNLRTYSSKASMTGCLQDREVSHSETCIHIAEAQAC